MYFSFYKGYLTIGIPTIKRLKAEYFFDTLASLLNESYVHQHAALTLVVMLADRDASFNEAVLYRIKV